MDRKDAVSPRHSSRAAECPTRFLEAALWTSGGWMRWREGGREGRGGGGWGEEEEAGIAEGERGELESVYRGEPRVHGKLVEVSVTAWPGSNIYLGDCVLLQCTVKSHSAFVKSYLWYRSSPRPAPNHRHLVSGDNYFITAVTMEDTDSYWCRAEYQDNMTSFSDIHSVMLSVSALSPPSLTVTPSTREMLSGDNFTIQCPASEANSAGWRLVHFSPDRTEINIYITNMTTEHVTQSDQGLYNRTVATTTNTVQYSPLRGAVSFAFTAATRTRGLYWCVNAEGRSNAVNITVSYDNIILKTPAFPVFTGDKVVLHCQLRTGNHNKTTFFKNGVEINVSASSSSNTVTEMTIENVRQEDEGLYKCASLDRKIESPESWLSVRPDQSSWKWIIVSCGVVLLLLIPLTVWLVCHYRYQASCACSFCPFFNRDVAAGVLPVTKQDVTEVQWDLSWMEMANLLDKQLCPGT
ncbi:hypothetical protein Q5P01_016331 [Channa striata]|uniref:Ig-like domain-containing protein n=1 Tax=Channa striata TaxID=64152 RepID=A0AA88MGT4_CHASR|nr:hypothetical protein Q5P01_016331 [Channa striata]